MDFRIKYPPGLEDEYDYWEIEQKGWLDITVLVNESELPLSVYDENRLSIDVRNEIARLGYFSARNILIVPRVTREEIESAIEKLAVRNFSDLID